MSATVSTATEVRGELRRQIDAVGGAVVALRPRVELLGGVGIYLIENTIAPLYYIGQSTNIRARWAQHRPMLNSAPEVGRKRSNKRLWGSWRKYGPGAFRFSVLETCVTDDLTAREQFWVSYYKEQFGERVCNSIGPVDSPLLGRRFVLSAAMKQAHKDRIVSRAKRDADAIRAEQLRKDALDKKPLQETLSVREMREEVIKAVRRAGGVRAFCRQHDIASHAAVSLTMAGTREPAEALANLLGFVRQIRYLKVGRGAVHASSAPPVTNLQPIAGKGVA